MHSVSYVLDDMSERASAALERIKQQAAKLVQDAQQQAEQIRQQAVEDGKQEAVREAERIVRADWERQTATALPALEQAVQAIEVAREAWIKQWNDTAIDLAAAIAQRVIRRELLQQPEIPLELVREALELASGANVVHLHMHPADISALGDRVFELIKRFESVGSAEVSPDDSIERGGCRVRTEFGVIDQTIETQLARIKEELGG